MLKIDAAGEEAEKPRDTAAKVSNETNGS